MCLAGSVGVQVEVIPLVVTDRGVHYIARDRDGGRWLRWVYSTDAHPMEVASAALTHAWGAGGRPRLLHGTSWRYTGGTVTLTFVALMSEAVLLAADWDVVELLRPGPLACGGAAEPPATIAFEQVRDHAIRHLAFLAEHDSSVQGVMAHDQAALMAWLPSVAAALPAHSPA